MSIETKWLVENQVFMVVLPAELDEALLEDYDELIVQILDKTAADKVHLVVDMRGLTKSPSLMKSRALKHPKHLKLGWGLLVGMSSNPVIRFTAATIAQLMHLRFKSFERMEDALAHLTKNEGIRF